MRDSNLVARDGVGAGNLTTTFTSAWLDLGKGGVGPNDLDWTVVVPQATGTSPTLDIKIDHSDDQTVLAETSVYAQITAAVTKRVRQKERRRYVRFTLTVAGTTPNFGAVDIRASSGMTGKDFNIANS